MKPYYQDNHIEIYSRDCRSMLELADNSVQCIVTSPPYWGLRKYSGEQELIWGGDKDCEHEWITKEHRDTRGVEGSNLTGRIPYKEGDARINYKDGFCSLCGAWKGAYGLEPTPEMYISHTIEILREIRRVLRKDGVVFWNIGDSYSSGGRKTDKPQTIAGGRDQGLPLDYRPSRDMLGHLTIKPKDLYLIPFRVAIAAQEDGWWVRSVIIWSKPNPMPESVTDRPTESHEYILMLTKSARYYWDLEAVREAYSPTERWGGDTYKGAIKKGLEGEDAGLDRERSCFPNTGRNIRSVWEFPTQPYPEAHFAVFPEKLPELCIKVATPEAGCCSKCGAPWERIINRTGHINKREPAYVPNNTPTKTDSTGWAPVAMGTDRWQPTCKCNADKVPSIVLDPFMGAGTTLWVAKRLNREAVGYEISEEYCDLALERNRQQALNLT